MKWSVVALACSLTPVASAAPPDCVPWATHRTLVAVGDKQVACMGVKGDCFDIEAHKPVKRPPIERTTTKLDKGKRVVCLDAACKPVGPKLAAALGAWSKERAKHLREEPNDPVEDWFELQITDDMSRVVIDTTGSSDTIAIGLWDVARDAQVHARTPREYADPKTKPARIDIEVERSSAYRVAGNAVIARWAHCWVRCQRGSLVGPDGAQIGGWFAYGPAIALAGNRIAVPPADAPGTLVVLDAATGKQLGSAVFDKAEVVEIDAVKLGPDTIGLLWRSTSDLMTARIEAPAGKPIAVKTAGVPTCVYEGKY